MTTRAATLLLLGATGAVGSQVLALALADPRVARVIGPTRRSLPAHPKLLNPIVDFAALPAADWWRADAGLCCLGTTRRQAGSAEAFDRIDRGYVLAAATLAQAAGTPVFIYNSSLGADATARSLYPRTKGRIEAELATLGFASLTHVRPSLLDAGPRPDSRPGERLALAVMQSIAFLLPRRIRPVTTTAVARALLKAALAAEPGVRIIESEAITG
jgi:uncharacterized protein YbjT (DUF2867 family)